MLESLRSFWGGEGVYTLHSSPRSALKDSILTTHFVGRRSQRLTSRGILTQISIVLNVTKGLMGNFYQSNWRMSEKFTQFQQQKVLEIFVPQDLFTN